MNVGPYVFGWLAVELGPARWSESYAALPAEARTQHTSTSMTVPLPPQDGTYTLTWTLYYHAPGSAEIRSVTGTYPTPIVVRRP